MSAFSAEILSGTRRRRRSDFVILATALFVQVAIPHNAFSGTRGGDCTPSIPGTCGAQGGGGNGNSKAAIMQNLFNAFQHGIQQSEQERQNQMQQQMEQENNAQQRLNKQIDHDFSTMKNAKSKADCRAVINDKARSNCYEHFVLIEKKQQAKQDAADEAHRKKTLSELPDKESDDILARFQPATPKKTAPVKQSTNANYDENKVVKDRFGNNCIALDQKPNKTPDGDGGYVLEIVVFAKNNCSALIDVTIWFDEKINTRSGDGVGPGRRREVGRHYLKNTNKYSVSMSSKIHGT